MAGTLILVNGLPGTGKSTLAKQLSDDLAYPLIGKDMLKEWLYDNMNASMQESAKLLGKSAAQMLYVIMNDFMAADKSLIVESAFQARYDRDEISVIVANRQARCLEIYCTTELEENRRRFTERLMNGRRHAVHIESVEGFVVNEEILRKYEPLDVGRTVKVDTTHFEGEDYKQLLETIRKDLA